jgi:hypothetical protein
MRKQEKLLFILNRNKSAINKSLRFKARILQIKKYWLARVSSASRRNAK